MIKVTLKDGVVKEFDKGITAAEVAKSLGMGLYRAACAARINGELVDLRDQINADCELEICTFDDPDGKHAFWHTSSHILAQAVKRLYPDAKFAIGPAIENGFYYDFDVKEPFTTDDLDKIEKEMKKIVKEKLEITRFILPPDEAIELMKDEPYKIELIKEHAAEGDDISFYQQGEFIDLCAGPHLLDLSAIKAIKLLSVTGAYWRGDQENQMLSRIYGISFPKAKELEEYLVMLEEAKKRDHRKLGRELEIFMMSDEGPGFPFFLPNGMILKNELLDFWRELHAEAGYHEIATPIILSRNLWEQSGHWEHYEKNMYTTKIDGDDYSIKPMNCPGGILVYKNALHSYRDLPLRYGELGLVHRHELSGALHGLMRVRSFTQDDAHVFMTEEQIKDEIKAVILLADRIYKMFDFDYSIELSTRPDDFMGAVEAWDRAEKDLAEAISELGMEYTINEGDGAFYGPKLDFQLKDSIGRTWQCGTIQLDFQMPERFDLEYTGADNQKHRPVMIHRALYGSIERFMGILIEHFAGALPTWLMGTQAMIIPIGDDQNEYADKLYSLLKENGIRVDVDKRNEKMGYKIREAQLKKIPYMLILGQREEEEGTVSLRCRKEGDLGAVSPEDFIEKITTEINTRAI